MDTRTQTDRLAFFRSQYEGNYFWYAQVFFQNQEKALVEASNNRYELVFYKEDTRVKSIPFSKDTESVVLLKLSEDKFCVIQLCGRKTKQVSRYVSYTSINTKVYCYERDAKDQFIVLKGFTHQHTDSFRSDTVIHWNVAKLSESSVMTVLHYGYGQTVNVIDTVQGKVFSHRFDEKEIEMMRVNSRLSISQYERMLPNQRVCPEYKDAISLNNDDGMMSTNGLLVRHLPDGTFAILCAFERHGGMMAVGFFIFDPKSHQFYLTPNCASYLTPEGGVKMQMDVTEQGEIKMIAPHDGHDSHGFRLTHGLWNSRDEKKSAQTFEHIDRFFQSMKNDLVLEKFIQSIKSILLQFIDVSTLGPIITEYMGNDLLTLTQLAKLLPETELKKYKVSLQGIFGEPIFQLTQVESPNKELQSSCCVML